jgi:hypothetical protein
LVVSWAGYAGQGRRQLTRGQLEEIRGAALRHLHAAQERRARADNRIEKARIEIEIKYFEGAEAAVMREIRLAERAGLAAGRQGLVRRLP